MTARPALLLLGGWLLVTAVPLAAARGPAVAAVWLRHAALAVGVLVALWFVRRNARRGARRGPTRLASVIGAELRALVAGWLPLVAVPPLYAELPAVAAGLAVARGGGAPIGFAPMHDAVVVGWELALFGPLLHASPAVALATRAPWTPLSELLHLAYLAYYVIIYGPPAVLWWEARRRRSAAAGLTDSASGFLPPGGPLPGPVTGATDPRAAFGASVFTVLLAFVLCYVVFVAFPVQGPWYTWGTGGPGGLPLAGPVRAFVQRLLVAGSSRGTAFPSSHVAVSVAQTAVLARVAPRLAGAVGVTTALLALGAVYGGYHYGVDALAGGLVGGAAGWAGPRLWSSWCRARGSGDGLLRGTGAHPL